MRQGEVEMGPSRRQFYRPFMGTLRLVEMAEQLQRNPETMVGLGIVGPDGQGLPVVRAGFLRQASPMKRAAEMAVRLGVVRLDDQRLLVTGDRFCVAFQFLECTAEIVVRLGKAGADRNG